MKKLIIASFMALIFALPIDATQSMPRWGEWYEVDNPGWHVDLHAQPGLKGALRCRIPHGEKLEVTESKRLQYDTSPYTRIFVHVHWMRPLGTMEWHWKDAHNNWCPHWNRKGWVTNKLIRKINKPGGPWIN